MNEYTISNLKYLCEGILKDIKKQKTYVNEVENENIYIKNKNKHLKQALLDIKEYIEENCTNYYVEEPHYRDLVDSIDILDIITKALEVEDE